MSESNRLEEKEEIRLLCWLNKCWSNINIPHDEWKLAREAYQEIAKTIKQCEEIKGIIRNPHLTQEHTMRDLLKLVKSAGK
jgi:hypothetical protein